MKFKILVTKMLLNLSSLPGTGIPSCLILDQKGFFIEFTTNFRSIAAFKSHLLTAHQGAEKPCIYEGCCWSSVKNNTYQECFM
jgi:hypothetical protein